MYEITDNTHIKLAENYAGTTGSGKTYAIIRNFSATMPSNLAADLTDLMKVYEQIRDGVYLTIQGESAYQLAVKSGYTGTEAQWLNALKGASAYELAVANGYTGTIAQWLASLHGADGNSAYELAVANGYTGTVSEWLDSLKSGGEWADADSRITATEDFLNATLIKQNYRNRNFIFRGKNLGAITEDHWAEITSGRYTDMYVGDYFTINGHRYTIAGWGPYGEWYKNRGMFMLYDTGMSAAMCAPYSHSKISSAIGTEGEEGYIPAAIGEYLESNWYVNLRPIFIDMIETDFGADHVKELEISVPTGHNTNGQMTAWVDSTSKAHLPTYSMLTGHYYIAPFWNANNSAFRMNGYMRYEQLPYFMFVKEWYGFSVAETLVTFGSGIEIDINIYQGQRHDFFWPGNPHQVVFIRPVFVIA